MVLEASTVDDQPFTSDSDPYEQNTSSSTTSSLSFTSYTPGQLPSHINPDTLARLPFYLRTFSLAFRPLNDERDDKIVRRLQIIEKEIGRSLTLEEQSAAARNYSHGFSIIKHGPPATVAWAVWRLYRTRDTLKVPFFGNLINSDGKTARFIPRWDGQTLRSAAGRDLLKLVSPTRRLFAVNLLRSFPYTILGTFFIIPIFDVYARFKVAVLDSTDPRLSEVVKEVGDRHSNDPNRQTESMTRQRDRMNEWRKARGQKPIDAAEGQTPPVDKDSEGAIRERTDPMGQGTINAGDLWDRHRRGIQKVDAKGQEVDDASPSGGVGMFGFEEDEKASQQRLAQERGMADHMQRRRDEANEMLVKQHDRRRHSRGRQTQREDLGTGEGMKDESDPGGNVWERLRQGAEGSETSASDTGIHRQQGASGDGSFSFSTREEEKTYVRDEAQKEFDEHIERERRGEDFDGSRGKRW